MLRFRYGDKGCHRFPLSYRQAQWRGINDVLIRSAFAIEHIAGGGSHDLRIFSRAGSKRSRTSWTACRTAADSGKTGGRRFTHSTYSPDSLTRLTYPTVFINNLMRKESADNTGAQPQQQPRKGEKLWKTIVLSATNSRSFVSRSSESRASA